MEMEKLGYYRMRNIVICSGCLKRQISVQSLMHTVVSVACDTRKKQQLYSLTMLTDLPLEWRSSVFSVRCELKFYV